MAFTNFGNALQNGIVTLGFFLCSRDRITLLLTFVCVSCFLCVLLFGFSLVCHNFGFDLVLKKDKCMKILYLYHITSEVYCLCSVTFEAFLCEIY